MSVTRLLSLACLALICVNVAAAEGEQETVGRLAVIQDPDGFVNIRAKPDTDSEVVLKIQEDEFVVCEPAESDWWRVKDFFGNEGYMQKSRIRLVRDLPGKTLERLFVNPPVAPSDELSGIREVSEQNMERYRERSRAPYDTNESKMFLDGSLFRNTELNQCIFITHYMDGMISSMVLFSSSDLPDDVLDELQISTRDGVASIDAKRANWSDLLGKALTIPSRHFETNKGLRLGEKVTKAIKIFGDPHNVRTSGNAKVYEWGFPGGWYYGWEYSESSLGFFDMERVAEDGESIEKLSLDAEQLRKIEEHMQTSKLEESLLEHVLPRTRGSRVDLGCGYFVRLYVRDGKIIALAYEWGIP